MDEQKASVSVETEAKFLVAPRYHNDTIKRFGSIEKIGEMHLGTPLTERINDTYFDTVDFKLAQTKSVLRSRLLKNNELLLTLKVKHANESKDRAIYYRREFEGPPDTQTIHDIWQALVDLNLVPENFSELDLYRYGFIGVFNQWNIQEMFKSKTKRTTRSILNDSDQHIATISLDEVTLLNSRKEKEYIEIEIEAIAGYESELTSIVKPFQKEFGSYITISEQSKYERGLEFVKWEDDFGNETKLWYSGALREVTEYVQEKGSLSGFVLDDASRYHIEDVYFDTPDYLLYKNNYYLRVRGRRKELLFTLRQYRRDKNRQIVDQFEIKHKVDPYSLTRIIKHLQEQKILSPLLSNPNGKQSSLQEVEQALARFSLYRSLIVDIDRTIHHVLDKGQHFGNIKLDQVTYKSIDDERTTGNNEIEVSIAKGNSNIEKVKRIVNFLSMQFGESIVVSNNPKYVTGITYLERGMLVNESNEIAQVFQRSSVRESILGRDVFIVHGHDGEAKAMAARLIGKLEFNAIILDEQPNASQTIIEKFEKHASSASYALVLLTPDDITAPNSLSEKWS